MRCHPFRWAVLSALMLSFAGQALAAEVTIYAKYRNGNLRIESSAPARYCKYWPAQCDIEKNSKQGIGTVDIPITYQTDVYSRETERRRSFYSRLPDFRYVDFGPAGPRGRLFILGLGMKAEWYDAGSNPSLLRHAIYRLGLNGAGTCTVHRTAQNVVMDALWLTTVNRGDCWSNMYTGPNETYTYGVQLTGFPFRLEIPGLKSMPPGVYKDRLIYRFDSSNSQEFDLGSRWGNMPDRTLVVNIELTVHADMHVNFPPGTDRAVLEPPGGWGRWTGRLPPFLSRDLPFRISVAGPFTVGVLCASVSSFGCVLGGIEGLRDGVSTRVSLTVPGATWQGGAVADIELPTHTLGWSSRRFEVPRAIVNGAAKLHFKLENLSSMQPGYTYQSPITVIFDTTL